VLGIFENWDCSLVERQLLAGDTFLLYTDGATESFKDAGEEFRERLVEALRRRRAQSSQALLASIVEEVYRFNPSEQQDDIRFIVARCRESVEAV
jgi:serine phosphatase RsbU (regulator of sigma subunit)